MTTIALPCCSFQVPDGWHLAGGASALAPTGLGQVISATATEQWGDREVSAVAATDQMRRGLERGSAPAKILESGPVLPPGAPGAVKLVYTTTGPRGEITRCTEVRLGRGPLLCRLLVVEIDPKTPDTPASIAEAIARTFRLEHVELAPGAGPVETGTLPPATASRPSQQVRSFGGVGLSLPIPDTFTAAEDAGVVTMTSREAVITVRRAKDANGQRWMNERMTALTGSPGTTLVGWGGGLLAPGRKETILRYTREVQTSQWKRAERSEHLDVHLGGPDSQEWSLVVGAPGSFAAAEAAFKRVLAATTVAPSKEAVTTVKEEWVEAQLAGVWASNGPGTWERAGKAAMMVRLTSLPCRAKLDRVRPVMGDVVRSLRQGNGLIRVLVEEEATGMFRGVEAYRFGFDGEFQTIGMRSARGTSLLSAKTLYSVAVTGCESGEVHAAFLTLLGGLKVPGMERV